MSSTEAVPQTTTDSPSKRKLSPSASPAKSPSKLKRTKESDENEMPAPVEVVAAADVEMKENGKPEEKVIEKEGMVAEEKKEVLKEIQENEAESPVSVPVQSTQPKLYFVRVTDKAHAPTRGSKLSAGYDLMSAYEYKIPARGSMMIKTDIRVQLPRGTYGRIAPRSGLALKYKIDVGAGVVDEDYRGDLGVILFNHGDEEFVIKEGDRVAQLICEKIYYPDIVEVPTIDSTERGTGGFGSTGVASA